MNKKKKIICSILSMIFLIFMIHLYEIKINSIIASIDNINQNLIQIITCTEILSKGSAFSFLWYSTHRYNIINN